jgi:GNAT superfamily N-acetyltransferase
LTGVTIYYLQMQSLEELNEKLNSNGLKIQEAEIKEFTHNRYLYTLVGKAWQWTDKLQWSDAQWQEYAEKEQLRTWVAYYKGTIAGYFELTSLADGDIEIAYFGLAPQFIGKGFGGYMLSCAIQLAWQECAAKRVIVNTCTLDHKGALNNYLARGFKIYRQQTE